MRQPKHLKQKKQIYLMWSAIIRGEQLLNITIDDNKLFFGFGWSKSSIIKQQQSLIDQFYLQLHTSIVEYVIAGKKTVPSNKDGQVKYHIELQLVHCSKFFENSIEKFGNATPKEILILLENYKKANNT